MHSRLWRRTRLFRLELFASTVCCILITNIRFIYVQLFQSDCCSFTSRKLYVCLKTFLYFFRSIWSWTFKGETTVNNYLFDIHSLRENVHYDRAKLKLRGTCWKIEFLHICSLVSLCYGKKRGGIISFKYYFKIRIITIFHHYVASSENSNFQASSLGLKNVFVFTSDR